MLQIHHNDIVTRECADPIGGKITGMITHLRELQAKLNDPSCLEHLRIEKQIQGMLQHYTALPFRVIVQKG